MGEPQAERLHFQYTVADPQPGMYYWVRPVHDGIEGITSTLAGPEYKHVPVDDAAGDVQLSIEMPYLGYSAMLSWRYSNPGDDNRDGTVDIRDWLDYEDEAELARLGATIEGFNIYVSDNPEHYPAANNAPSSIPRFDYKEPYRYPDYSFDSYFRRVYEELDIAHLAEPLFFWVRPVYNGQEGTPSNMVEVTGIGAY
jgi:hypothetical protein